MLIKLAGCCADGSICAFAGDTATVVPDFGKDAPLIQTAFDEFERVSGIALNCAKCVIIPLTVAPLQDFQTTLQRSIPRWQDMVVTDWGT
jgi:hypothetical protein